MRVQSMADVGLSSAIPFVTPSTTAANEHLINLNIERVVI